MENGRFRTYIMVSYGSQSKLCSLLRKCNERISKYVYILHDKDKYQYSYTNLVSNDIQYFERLCKHGVSSTRDEKALAIIRDMMKGVPKRLLLVRYGRDVIINYQKYNDFCDILRMEDYDEQNRKRVELEPLEEDDDKQLQIPFD